MTDEADNASEDAKGVSAKDAGFSLGGFIVGVFFGWLLFDSFALGLIAGLIGGAIAGGASRASRKEAPSSDDPA